MNEHVHPGDPRPATDGPVVWDSAAPRRATDLAGFLLARIAEDEAVVQAALQTDMWGTPGSVARWEYESRRLNDGNGAGIVWNGRGQSVSRTMHEQGALIARWDPARVLVECEAKRRIVESATQGGDCQGHPGSYQPHGEYGPGYCRDFSDNQYLRLLALPHADHPDYDESWRP